MILRKVEGEPHAQVHVIEWSRTQVVSTTWVVQCHECCVAPTISKPC